MNNINKTRVSLTFCSNMHKTQELLMFLSSGHQTGRTYHINMYKICVKRGFGLLFCKICLKWGGFIDIFWSDNPRRNKKRIKIYLRIFCPKTRISAVPVRFFDYSGHKQGCGPYIYACCRVKTWSKIWVFLSQNLVQGWVKTWSKIFVCLFSQIL